MASSNDNLAVQTRTKIGTTGSKALRREGKFPGVLFGHGTDPVPIALDSKAFAELLHTGGKNHLLNITIDGTTKDTALVRDLQRHPINRRVIHADLQRVGASETIGASLPLVTVGVPDGVRNSGGVMDVVMHALAVEGPADRIPEHIEVDVSHLGVHHHFTAGDVKLPDGFSLKMDPATILISIEPSKTEQEAVDSAPAPVAADVPTVADTAAGSAP